MKYIDTHCHLNFELYKNDRDIVIEKAANDSVSVINIGTQQNTSKLAVELADQNNHLFAIIGLHPIHTSASFHDHEELGEQGKEFHTNGEVFDVDFYRLLGKSSKKVVGIGECGLDYYRSDTTTIELQKKAFRDQIELAIELNLPLMLHVRPANDSYTAYFDVLEILKEYKAKHSNLRGQTHFFAGTKEIADEFIKLGFYISFTGVITFAKVYEEVVAHVPVDMILAETDSPYVTPSPLRGQRNEPIHVIEVYKKIAAIKNMSVDQLAAKIKTNVATLYGI